MTKENRKHYYLDSITKEQVEYYYIGKNLDRELTGNYLKITARQVETLLKKFGIHKSKELQKNPIKRLNLTPEQIRSLQENNSPELFTEICNKLDTFPEQVYKWINKLRKKEKIVLDEKLLYEYYITENLMITEVADKFNCGIHTVEINLKSYGIKKPKKLWYEALKRHNLELYKVENVSSLKEVRDKVVDTVQRKYGVDNISQLDETQDKVKATCLSKYGQTHTNTPETISKTRETWLSKYGVPCSSQAECVKEKFRKTCLRKYGQPHTMTPENWLKMHNTKKSNGSYTKSKEEDKVYEILKQYFSTVTRQYYCKEYPFSCDFYIPECELFIEYQGHVRHGREPFNPNNSKHLEKVKYWKRKSEELNYKGTGKKSQYLDFIDCWTKRSL